LRPEAVCAHAVSRSEAAMGRLVMKFGGTSVENIEHIRNVARHVKREVGAGHEVAVVVSAMAGTTNRLVEWCREAAVLHDAREYDTVVAVGEQVTSGLLAIALQGIGVPARSWQGWQLPIATTDAHGLARILEINGEELVRRFKERGEVAVISGFQGVHKETGRITTLGRGGSDTSAVAVAAAIRADRCDIYTDVDGVYTSDPRVVPKARRLDKIAFEEMLEFASLGAKVLQVRSVELGMVHNVRICVRSSFEQPDVGDPRGSPAGTLICDEEEIVEQHVVTGIAFSKDEAQISIRRVRDKPGVAAAIFGPLAEANINVDMIVQNVSGDGATTDITFTVPAADYERASAVLAGSRPAIGYERVDGANDVAKVSVIGIGMRSHAGVAAQAFRALAERGINIRAITTSEIKFSLLIDAAYTELAVRTLHSLYGLDR
jgi:aspartate kinase